MMREPTPTDWANEFERGWAACAEANHIKLERLRAENDRLIDENAALRADALALKAVRDTLTDWANEAREDLSALGGDIRALRERHREMPPAPPRGRWWKREQVTSSTSPGEKGDHA